MGVKPFKMLHCQALTASHVAMRVYKCREILQEIAEPRVQGREEIRHPTGAKPAK